MFRGNYWALWGKYTSVRFTGPYFEVDLGDTRSENSLFGLIWSDGTLRLHIPVAKCPIHYMGVRKHLLPLQNAKRDAK